MHSNLNVAVPVYGNYLSNDTLFNRSAVFSAPWGGLDFDVFALHNRWNRDEVEALVGPAVPTMTILRHPVDQFESLYSYMNLTGYYNTSLQGFVEQLRLNKSYIEGLPRAKGGRFGRNQMAFDLGIDPKVSDVVPELMTQHVARLQKEFHLVMISERLEESLILMADQLCWPLDRVTHLNLNVRKPKTVVKLLPDERKILEEWLQLDLLLYNHFYERFEERIEQFNVDSGRPDAMNQSIAMLRRLNLAIRKRCVIERTGNELLTGIFAESHNGTLGYFVDP